MGFIEEMERRRQHQIQQELTRKAELERQLQIVTQEEQSLRLEVAREKARLLALQKEAKLRFDESGVPSLLERMREIGAIDKFEAENRDDGMHCCKVKISSAYIGVVYRRENAGLGGYGGYDVDSNKIFRIVTDSTGTITFQYGYFLPRKKRIEQSLWKRNPYMLEELLEKAYKSPSREREEHYRSPPQYNER